MRWLLGLLAVVLATGVASAHPKPLDIAEDEPEAERPTLIEWSTWLRGAVIVATDAPDTAARTTTPKTPEADRTVAGAIGAGFTLPVGSSLRIGPWVEFRGWGVPVLGGEITVLPGSLDMFWYKGQSAITARAGANPDVRTAQLGVAYRAPWNLYGPRPRGSRYMIGAGIAVTATQNRNDPRDWSVAIGIELEPIGAIRYLLGIRSWY